MNTYLISLHLRKNNFLSSFCIRFSSTFDIRYKNSTTIMSRTKPMSIPTSRDTSGLDKSTWHESDILDDFTDVATGIFIYDTSTVAINCMYIFLTYYFHCVGSLEDKDQDSFFIPPHQLIERGAFSLGKHF